MCAFVLVPIYLSNAAPRGFMEIDPNHDVSIFASDAKKDQDAEEDESTAATDGISETATGSQEAQTMGRPQKRFRAWSVSSDGDDGGSQS